MVIFTYHFVQIKKLQLFNVDGEISTAGLGLHLGKMKGVIYSTQNLWDVFAWIFSQFHFFYLIFAWSTEIKPLFPLTEWKKSNPVQPNSSNKFKTEIHIAVASKTNLTLKLAQQRTWVKLYSTQWKIWFRKDFLCTITTYNWLYMHIKYLDLRKVAIGGSIFVEFILQQILKRTIHSWIIHVNQEITSSWTLEKSTIHENWPQWNLIISL